MYDNIGGKIKGLAKTMFIVEAIGAVITGIALLATDDDFILVGLLTLFCGPIVAWVSSWILYAFGELVEKTCDNENNTRQILEILNEKTNESEIAPPRKATSVPPKTNEPPKEKKKEYVDNATSSIINKNSSTAPYWCGKCGHDGPYDGNCPNCNSSLKKYNV